ncbi:MAG: ABC transporter substrate-binding protein [Bacteroidota bacterium]
MYLRSTFGEQFSNRSYTPSSLFFFLLLFLTVASCRSEPEDVPVDAENDISGIDFKRTQNEVALSLPGEPDALNPLLTTQAYSRYVFENIFQTLNYVDPQTYELKPYLASRPEIIEQEDGTIDYRYELVDGATWPNGSPVTTVDVDFSFKALLNPLVQAGRYRSFYTDVYDLVVEDERNFTVRTRQPYLLTDDALASVYIYPAYAYDPDGIMAGIPIAELADPDQAAVLAESNEGMQVFAESFNSFETAHDPSKIVGSGAYELESWEEGQRIRLLRRDDYWAADATEGALAALPEALVFAIIPDAQTAVVALQDEQVDVVIEMDADRFDELREDPRITEKVKFLTEPSFVAYSVIMNMEDPMLSDAKTRQALAHLIDVDLLIEEYYGGMGMRLSNAVLPMRPYYDKDLALRQYDVAAAIALLAEAGWTDSDGDGILDRDGTPLALTLLAFDTPTGASIGLLLKEGCREAGIELNLQNMEGRALYGELNQGSYQLATYAQGYQPSADEFTQSWSTRSVPPNGTNRMRFGNQESDQIIDQIRVTLDPAAREPLYQRMQKIFYEEQPLIFLYSPLSRIVISRRFAVESSSLTPGFRLGTFRHLQ